MQTEARNPYQAPNGALLLPDQFGEVRVLSASGRLGRVRYLGYAFGFNLALMFVLFVWATILGDMLADAVIELAVRLAYVATLAIAVMLTIRRCHDMDLSGWWALLVIIPFVNLMFWFSPGTVGTNRFGVPPPPNTTGMVILALLFPMVFVFGIAAAYKQYVETGGASAMQQHSE